MIKVIFVCHGNICRSPSAEYIFKKLVNDNNLSKDFDIDSAATSTDVLNYDIYPPAKTCLINHNIPISKHKARQITKTDIDYFDYIIAMEKYNITDLQKMFGDSAKYSLLLDYTDKPGDIDDPWYTRDFDTAYSQIEKGCICLLSKMLKSGQQ